MIIKIDVDATLEQVDAMKSAFEEIFEEAFDFAFEGRQIKVKKKSVEESKESEPKGLNSSSSTESNIDTDSKF